MYATRSFHIESHILEANQQRYKRTRNAHKQKTHTSNRMQKRRNDQSLNSVVVDACRKVWRIDFFFFFLFCFVFFGNIGLTHSVRGMQCEFIYIYINDELRTTFYKRKP